MQRKQLGLSLIELMIAITLGLVLMTGVVQMFLSSKVIFSTQQGMSRIQETGRLAIEFMSRDVRMAAYYGCYRPVPPTGVNPSTSTDLQNKNLVIAGLHGNFGEGVRGYDNITSLPGGQSDVGAGLTLLAADKTAHVLVVRSANELGFPISAANNANNVIAYSANPLVDGCAEGICPNSAVVVSDCYKARVFQATNVSLAGNTLTLQHADSWGGGSVALENFTSGEVLPINTTVYFLAEGASGAPSLWQKTNTEEALELLEGVERMRITYATTDNTDYRLASALAAADWANVTSARLELVVRSLENNVLDDTQPFTFAGATITPADIDGVKDRYMRQVFTSTIGIRSRAVLQ
jgi:type IV pilus assembly protein PilW